MPLISRLRDFRYCAFCKTRRRVYVKKHVDLTNVLCALLLAATLAFVFWSEPDPRGLFLFGLFISAAELFVYVRWRWGMRCRMCGFDPLLYKKSPALAAARVKEFFHIQMENPGFLLTKSPLLDLQRQIRDRENKAKAREAILRRSKVTPSKTL